MIEHWKTLATTYFNLGGLIGTLLTIPASKWLGRKPMFIVYFLVSAAAVMGTFGLFYVGIIPLIGILLMPWVIETRGRALSD